MGRVVAIASGKGGSGKSVVTANLGIGLSRFGKNVLMIDSDISMPNLDIFVGLKDAPITLHDILSKKKPVDKAIYQVFRGVNLIPCSRLLDAFFRANIRGLKGIIAKVRDKYDYVLIDTPSGLNKYNLATIRYADEVLWVVNPDEASIVDTIRLKSAVELFHVRTLGMVVNRVPSFSWSERRKLPKIRKTDLEMRLGCKILGIIPEDKEVYKAAILQMPYLEYKKSGKVVNAFKELCRTILKSETLQQV